MPGAFTSGERYTRYGRVQPARRRCSAREADLSASVGTRSPRVSACRRSAEAEQVGCRIRTTQTAALTRSATPAGIATNRLRRASVHSEGRSDSPPPPPCAVPRLGTRSDGHARQPHAKRVRRLRAPRSSRWVPVVERHGMVWLGGDADGAQRRPRVARARNQGRVSQLADSGGKLEAASRLLDGYNISTLHRDAVYSRLPRCGVRRSPSRVGSAHQRGHGAGARPARPLPCSRAWS